MSKQTTSIPLLKDHHSHPLLYASFAAGVELSNVHSQSDAIKLLRGDDQDSGSEVTIGYGWRDNRFQFDEATLDDLPPTVIFNLSLHWLVLNRSAKDLLRSKYGDDVDRIHDPIWYEQNFRQVLNWFARLNGTAKSLQSFYDSLLLQGVAYCEELALVDGNEIDLFDEAGLTERTRFWATPDVYSALSPKHQESVFGLKLFTDGALGSRTAALHRPFLPSGSVKDNRGMLIYNDRQLESQIEFCLGTGKSLAIHAIGDRAIDQTVSTLGLFKQQVSAAPEVRIEHAQMISGVIATEAKTMGLKLSMQPNFNQDSADYTDRLDKGYCNVNNPFRMLIDHVGFVPGEDLIFGSDGMPHGIENAISMSLFPPVPSQRLSIEEFVAGYCMNGKQPANGTIPDGKISLTIDQRLRTVECEVQLS